MKRETAVCLIAMLPTWWLAGKLDIGNWFNGRVLPYWVDFIVLYIVVICLVNLALKVLRVALRD